MRLERIEIKSVEEDRRNTFLSLEELEGMGLILNLLSSSPFFK